MSRTGRSRLLVVLAAGAQLGPTAIVKRCSATVTHTCISSQTDSMITVKPPPELTGNHWVSVASARLMTSGGSMWAETAWAAGGFGMTWTSGPVVTNVS
jgi:hypothetical protein